MSKDMVPKRIFFTKGVGKHRERLTSFELALRDAGIAAQNLVRVSSIFPPNCKLVPRSTGLKFLHPGEVVFAVVAENSTREAIEQNAEHHIRFEKHDRSDEHPCDCADRGRHPPAQCDHPSDADADKPG